MTILGIYFSEILWLLICLLINFMMFLSGPISSKKKKMKPPLTRDLIGVYNYGAASTKTGKM